MRTTTAFGASGLAILGLITGWLLREAAWQPAERLSEPGAACTAQDDGHGDERSGLTLTLSDRARRQALNEAMLELESQGRLQPFNELPRAAPDARPQLVAPAEVPLDGPAVYERLADATVMFHAGYKCDRCDNWHGGVTTGFIVHPEGWIVTAAHIVDDLDDNRACGVMLRDGRAFAVESVAIVDEDHDIALVKIDADEVLPVAALAASSPRPGEHIYVLSHPQNHFFLLTDGIVSRVLGDGASRLRLQITAEYATGSSGAPVADDRGNIVGMVISTHTLYAEHEDERNPQHVIRSCVLCDDIRAVIEE